MKNLYEQMDPWGYGVVLQEERKVLMSWRDQG
jgi:hypothetical protein